MFTRVGHVMQRPSRGWHARVGGDAGSRAVWGGGSADYKSDWGRASAVAEAGRAEYCSAFYLDVPVRSRDRKSAARRCSVDFEVSYVAGDPALRHAYSLLMHQARDVALLVIL